MKFLIFLLMFFVLGALLIISNHGISFLESGDFKNFGIFYFDWLSKVFGNFGKLSGDVVKLDWGQ